MIMLLLGRMPTTGDTLDWENWRFEVVDMDGKRIDKVLATPILPGEDADEEDPDVEHDGHSRFDGDDPREDAHPGHTEDGAHRHDGDTHRTGQH